MMRNELSANDWNNFLPFDFLNDWGKNWFSSSLDSFKTDISENKEQYTIKAELPGFKKANLKLDFTNDILTVTANRNQNDEQKDTDGNLIRSERRFGQTTRQFYLRGGNRDQISAQYDGGILTVIVPKENKDTSEQNQIPIN